MRSRRPIIAVAVVTLAALVAVGAAVQYGVESASVTSHYTPALTPTPESSTRTASDTPPPEPTPSFRLQSFDAGRAMKDVRALESFGVRSAGSAAEREGANYIARRLRSMGYSAELVEVPLTNGRSSVNVVARKRGRSDKVVVLGAHMDSKSPSPGANDNLSGTAAVLEIARIVSAEQVEPTLEFVLFGAEETIDGNPDHHHFGSRRYVTLMSRADRDATAAMVSVDMIGAGNEFTVRTMGVGTMRVVDMLKTLARKRGVRLNYLKDLGQTGWSDHEAFELAGIPAAWIEWRNDPVYHTAKDRSGHLNEERVRQAGQLTLDFVRAMNKGKLEAWTTR